MSWTDNVVLTVKRTIYEFLVWKLERKKLFWRPRRRWEGTIKMDFK